MRVGCVVCLGTLEAFADGVAGDVDEVALLEEVVEDEGLAGLEAVEGAEAELLEVAHGGGAGLAEVAELGAGELGVADAAVADLDGVVAVGGGGLELGDDVALAEADDGDGHRRTALRLEVGHHPQLRAHHPHPRLHAAPRRHPHRHRPPLSAPNVVYAG